MILQNLQFPFMPTAIFIVQFKKNVPTLDTPIAQRPHKTLIFSRLISVMKEAEAIVFLLTQIILVQTTLDN